MSYVQFMGGLLPQADTLSTLYTQGYRILLEPYSQFDAQNTVVPLPSVVVLALSTETEIAQFGYVLHRQAIPWIGWNTHDEPELTVAAYAFGACAVLPSTMNGAILLQAMRLACSGVAPARSRTHRQESQYVYRRGMTIRLDAEESIDVIKGVVAQIMLHHDGYEVLMGLSGPGQLLLGHPDDACCVLLRAHTDTTVIVRSWQSLTTMQNVTERLRARVRMIEGWSAMQARPYLDQRITGILSVLAEQFGVPYACGLVVDVRITHAQLAAAVGATRSTVTRLLSDLRARGILITVGSGENERYCLCHWEATDHLQPRNAPHLTANIR